VKERITYCASKSKRISRKKESRNVMFLSFGWVNSTQRLEQLCAAKRSCVQQEVLILGYEPEEQVGLCMGTP
jgi:hypothetical protein